MLPLNLLIAQADGRLVSVTPRGQVVWRRRQSDPGAVSVTRTGRTLVIAEPAEEVLALRRVDSGRLAYVFGRRGQAGSGPGLLDDPRSAFETSSGEIAIADSANCRVVLVEPGARAASSSLGRAGDCAESVRPLRFSDPVSAIPEPGGRLLVTETGPPRAVLISASGAVIATTPLPGLDAASDARLDPYGGIVVTERSDPGAVEELSATGAVSWRRGGLDDPAMALVLPDGDVLVVDSGNDRVIVIDRATNAIVWQYGHSGVPGHTPGYLDDPQSAALVPIGR